MSFTCPGNSNVSPIVQNSIRVVKGYNPNPTPVIYGLSSYSSLANSYIKVSVFGKNFFPFGTTTITFGPVENIQVDYLSSSTISFSLPISSTTYIVPGGIYDVYAVNINNTTQIIPIALYSNKIKYYIL